MTVRYVDGSAGNNSWDGLAPNFVSGSNGPKLTWNGAEDTPVAAGDLVHVRSMDVNGVPIVYREMLTVDVSGTAGNPIEYRADVGGVIWPIGGICRITGSDNDTTATRASVISATSKDYRTFTGFAFDTTTGTVVNLVTACSNWIIQDCFFIGQGANAASMQNGGTGTACTVRRCVFWGGRSSGLSFSHSTTVSNAGHVVENCVFAAFVTSGVISTRVGGITVRDCAFLRAADAAVRVLTALAVGQTVAVNNCIICWGTVGLNATISGEIVEDYNTFWGNTTDRTNTAVGANSNTYSPLFNPLLLLSGYRLPQLPMLGLSAWSPLRALAGTGMSADDLFGITRPVADSSKSWGAIQFVDKPIRNLPIFSGIVR